MKNTHFSTGIRKLKRLVSCPRSLSPSSPQKLQRNLPNFERLPTRVACTPADSHTTQIITLIDLEDSFILLFAPKTSLICVLFLPLCSLFGEKQRVFCRKLYLRTCLPAVTFLWGPCLYMLMLRFMEKLSCTCLYMSIWGGGVRTQYNSPIFLLPTPHSVQTSHTSLVRTSLKTNIFYTGSFRQEEVYIFSFYLKYPC